MIKLINVEKIYTNGIMSFKALNGINIHIKEGEFTSIIGSSGSGKSTIMNILGCLDTPTAGSYFLDGVDISKSTEDELAEIRNRKIGFVFQSFNLLPKLTAFENVELPMVYAGVHIKERRERTLKALDMVGLSDKLKNRPPELSGGQRQRVAIARAMVNSPKIILADEPTGNLDSHSEVEIMNIFKELNKNGVTIVMVTHEPEIAANSRRVITVKDGMVIGDK